MNRDPDLPLTETTYYTLVALLEPCHGYKILNRIKELSEGQVHVAPGTLYGALENLEKQEFITLVEAVGSRKKVFQITEKGLAVLKKDRQRLIHMADVLEQNRKGRSFPKNKAFKDSEKNEGKSRGSREVNDIEKKKIKKKKQEEDLFY